MALLEICFVFIVSNHFSFVSSLNEEGLALLLFKNLTSDAEGFLQNWNSSDANPCSWNGITCTEQRVVSLSIADKKLSGTLHPALGKLVSLRYLSLRNNKLFGSFPTELSNLVELQSLDLSQNVFNGSIPDGFGSHLTSLQNLNLSFNVIHGSIPADFGNLSNLRGTLDLSHNVFIGPIPLSLSSLPATLYIDLSYNNLSGSIPSQEAFQNLGPTAYVGNAFLCGLPLNVSCPSTAPTSNPNSWFHCPSHGKGGKSCSIITASASIIVGFCLVILVVFWCKRSYPSKGNGNLDGCNFREALMFKTEFSCFAKHDVEPLPENMEKYNFVLLDRQVDFNLEQLLKASAYLLGKNGNGIVYRVVLEKGLKLAVRRLEDGAYERFKEFQNEVEAIGKIRHPNIVALFAYCWSVEEKLLIHEYIPQGDLATSRIQSKKIRPWRFEADKHSAGKKHGTLHLRFRTRTTSKCRRRPHRLTIGSIRRRNAAAAELSVPIKLHVLFSVDRVLLSSSRSIEGGKAIAEVGCLFIRCDFTGNNHGKVAGDSSRFVGDRAGSMDSTWN